MKEEHIASEHLQLKWVTKSDNKRVISFIKEYELLKEYEYRAGKDESNEPHIQSER